MKRFVFVMFLFLLLGLEARANSYRHTGIKERSNRAVYIKIGYYGVFSGHVDELSKLDLLQPPGQPLDIINIDLLPLQNSSIGLTTRKIGVNAALIYRTSFFLRYEGKLDFTTGSKRVPYSAGVAGSGTDVSFLITTRIFSAVGTAYIDFNNPSFVTPFIGVGYGVGGVANFVSMTVDNTFYQAPPSTAFGNAKAVIEYKGGLKFDSKGYYIDFEYINKRLPSLGLSFRGLNIGIAFRL